ncbi:hypothetical protein [Streptomyces sp. G1]|uniref:hypothetical protein n=1 Tax=Streptomyces sp. G1 TaxID=361572 RepID=UPI00202FC2C5|nr:hypothetical protein [Streptomyces sp. G1]MCM1972325.1 hypothetical protein [Streptomyces sp. G1]
MALLAELTDDFSGEALDTVKWPQSYGDPDVADGRGRVPCTTGFAGIRSASAYTLTGSHVLARVYPPTPSGATSAACSLLVLSTVGGTDAGFIVDTAQGAMGLYLREGYADGAALFPTYDPVEHAWLRLREDDGTLYWECAPDGQTWSVLRTATTPEWAAGTELSLLFEAHRDAGTDDHAEIDNINLPPGEAVEGAAAGQLTAALASAGQVGRSAVAGLDAAAGLTASGTVGTANGGSLAAAAALAASGTVGAARSSRLAAAIGLAASGQVAVRGAGQPLALTVLLAASGAVAPAVTPGSVRAAVPAAPTAGAGRTAVPTATAPGGVQ